MRWLALLLLLIATPANAAVTFVNGWKNGTATAPVSIDTSTGTQMKAGDLCVAAVNWFDSSHATSASMSGWNTAVAAWSNGNVNMQVFYKQAQGGDVGATFSIQVGAGGSFFPGAGIACFRGAAAAPDAAGAGSSGISTVATAASITLALSGDVLLWLGGGDGVSVILPTGYSTGFNVAFASGTNDGCALGYTLDNSSGATGAVSSNSSHSDWTAVLVGFNLASVVNQYVNPTLRLGRPHPIQTWRH